MLLTNNTGFPKCSEDSTRNNSFGRNTNSEGVNLQFSCTGHEIADKFSKSAFDLDMRGRRGEGACYGLARMEYVNGFQKIIDCRQTTEDEKAIAAVGKKIGELSKQDLFDYDANEAMRSVTLALTRGVISAPIGMALTQLTKEAAAQVRTESMSNNVLNAGLKCVAENPRSSTMEKLDATIDNPLSSKSEEFDARMQKYLLTHDIFILK